VQVRGFNRGVQEDQQNKQKKFQSSILPNMSNSKL